MSIKYFEIFEIKNKSLNGNMFLQLNHILEINNPIVILKAFFIYFL